MATSNDGFLASASKGDTISIWDMNSGKLTRTLSYEDDNDSDNRQNETNRDIAVRSVSLLCFLPNGHLASAVKVKREMRDTHVELVQLDQAFPQREYDIYYEIDIWNALNGALVTRTAKYDEEILSMAAFNNGHLASAANGRVVKIWNTIEHNSQLFRELVDSNKEAVIRALAVLSDDLLACGVNKSIRIWSVSQASL